MHMSKINELMLSKLELLKKRGTLDWRVEVPLVLRFELSDSELM